MLFKPIFYLYKIEEQSDKIFMVLRKYNEIYFSAIFLYNFLMNKINFWVLNILISSNILKYPLFFVAFWLIGTEHPSYPQIIFENTILQVLFIVTVPIVFIALYWLFKTFVFIVIFASSTKKNTSQNMAFSCIFS